MRLHYKNHGMRIGMENGFEKSGKQRIEDKAAKASGQYRAGIRRIVSMSSIGGQTGIL